MMKYAVTGKVSKQHAYNVLIPHNLIPPPIVGIPPAHKDWHHNCHYSTDSRGFFEYYGATLESNHELLQSAKNADSNWQSYSMVTDLAGTWILPFVDAMKVKFNYAMTTRGDWENKPEEWGRLTVGDINRVLNRALDKARPYANGFPYLVEKNYLVKWKETLKEVLVDVFIPMTPKHYKSLFNNWSSEADAKNLHVGTKLIRGFYGYTPHSASGR